MNVTSNNQEQGNTETLNCLLRSEMTAVATYTQVLVAFDDQQVIADLQKIRDDHNRAVRELRDQVVMLGGKPADSCEQGGAFATVVTQSLASIGPATALAALRQGEEHGISEYEAALENANIRAASERTIRADLLPACRKHVDELNRLLGGMSH